jgi:hypothetical protein
LTTDLRQCSVCDQLPAQLKDADVVDQTGAGQGEPENGTGAAAEPELSLDHEPESAPTAAAGGNRRVPILIGAAVVSLVLIAGAAFAALRLWPSASVDPAERLPDSAVFYMEINLDPGSDQTTNLMRLLDKFDALEDATDVEARVSDLLAELDLDDVDPDDVTPWLGTRGAAAVWIDPANEDFTIGLALASRNDHAARDGLAVILEASDDEFGYVVDDGLAVLAFTESGAQAKAEEIVADGHAAPLADSARFQADLESLDGEQLALMWVNFAEIAAMTEEFLTLAGGPGEVGFEEIYDLYETESAVVGVRATDAGLEVRFRSDGDFEILSGQADWLERMGGLRTAQIGATMTFPDISEVTQPFLDDFAELYDTLPTTPDDFFPGLWDYEFALTDEEFDEYLDLYDQWENGSLDENDPDFIHLVELEDQYWLFGLRSDFDEWIAAGYTEEEWWAEHALTADEFEELLELEALYYGDELTEVGEERYFELDYRRYSFGVAGDLFAEPPVDVVGLVEELYDLVSGATFTVALGDLFAEPGVGVSVKLANGPADRLLDLPIPELDELVAELGDALSFAGDTVTFGDLEGTGEKLAEHPRFDEAFADSPNDAFLALFVDVRTLNATAPEPEEWLEPVSVVTMVYGTDGSGIIRVLID